MSGPLQKKLADPCSMVSCLFIRGEAMVIIEPSSSQGQAGSEIVFLASKTSEK